MWSCAVREKPEAKVAAAIARIVAINPEAIICVLGCVAQSLGKKLYDCAPEVRLLAGGDGLVHVPGAIAELLADPDLRLAFLEFTGDYAERGGCSVVGGSAYVNIMQGCDNFCAYCIVPYTRGRQKSRKRVNILAECARCVEAGALEITLLGQNVNAWGRDGGISGNFASLLAEVSAMPGLARLRFVAVHPRDMDEGSIAAFAELPNVCPRLHLPLQSGSDRILAAMHRRYDSAGFLRLVESLRKARPDIALSTDLIVGFPGETEQDFNDTLAMVRECGFMSSYSFCYSDRPPARASLMPDKIAGEIQLERLTRLQELQENLGSRWLMDRVGQDTTVLLEGPSPRSRPGENSWQGRDPYGVAVNLAMPAGNHAGKITQARIISAKKHSLLAEALVLACNN